MYLFKIPLNHGFPTLHFIFFIFIFIIIIVIIIIIIIIIIINISIIIIICFLFVSLKNSFIIFSLNVIRYQGISADTSWDDYSTTLLQCLMAGVAVL